MDKENFVRRVKMLCAQKGIKPTVACRESGAGPSMMSQIETRGCIPSVEKVQMLASYLGVTTSELLGERKETMVVDKEGFVRKIKMLCAQKGVRPTNACKESGVGSSFINDIERGRVPSVEKVQMLAHYLGVSINELLGTKTDDPDQWDPGKITVTYTLDEYQQRQLAAIGEAEHEEGLDSLFAHIMQIGSTYDIAWKLAIQEYKSGLRKEFPTQDMVNAETRERLRKQAE